MKVIPRCGACSPDADPTVLLDGAIEASCANCGCVVRRHRRWKQNGDGIAVADDVFTCSPPESMASTAKA